MYEFVRDSRFRVSGVALASMSDEPGALPTTGSGELPHILGVGASAEAQSPWSTCGTALTCCQPVAASVVGGSASRRLAERRTDYRQVSEVAGGPRYQT